MISYKLRQNKWSHTAATCQQKKLSFHADLLRETVLIARQLDVFFALFFLFVSIVTKNSSIRYTRTPNLQSKDDFMFWSAFKHVVFVFVYLCVCAGVYTCVRAT